MSEVGTLVAVGAGSRTTKYCRCAVSSPSGARIVAVAEPNDERRKRFAREFDIPESMQFTDYRQLAQRAPVADAAVNGTMDPMHYESTAHLLDAGYHVLLEKPIAQTLEHVQALVDQARRRQRLLMICHVLRYAPFYERLHELIGDGEIGPVRSLRTGEHVAYHHFATSFVRGKWNRQEVNPVLLAKCCHDLDLICWLLGGPTPQRVSSFGGLSHFKADQAPAGAAKRCLDGCAIESECAYSARRIHVEAGLWPKAAFATFEDPFALDRQQRYEAIKDPANPFGRCVWHCDNDVVDHQSVLIEFADGVTATHDLFPAAPRATRTIYILGTQGEIVGDFASGQITLRQFDIGATTGQRYRERQIDIHHEGVEQQGGHGGGDARLMHDFLAMLHGKAASPQCTTIDNSITSHEIAFAAQTAIRERRVVEREEMLGVADPAANLPLHR